MRWILILLLWAHVVMALDAPQVSISVDAGRFDTVFVELSWNRVVGADHYLVQDPLSLLTEVPDTLVYFQIPTNWGFETPNRVCQPFVVWAESEPNHSWAGTWPSTEWDAAQNMAVNSHNGYLACIGSQHEQGRMMAWLDGWQTNTQNLWLGAVPNLENNSWNWVDGSAWTYDNWADGEWPITLDWYHRIVVDKQSGEWFIISGVYESRLGVVEVP